MKNIRTSSKIAILILMALGIYFAMILIQDLPALRTIQNFLGLKDKRVTYEASPMNIVIEDISDDFHQDTSCQDTSHQDDPHQDDDIIKNKDLEFDLTFTPRESI